jgi:hypothetical protein
MKVVSLTARKDFKMGLFGAAVVLTICVTSVLADRTVQNDSVQGARLNSRIGPANLTLYQSIRDAKDWENPYLVIL